MYAQRTQALLNRIRVPLNHVVLKQHGKTSRCELDFSGGGEQARKQSTLTERLPADHGVRRMRGGADDADGVDDWYANPLESGFNFEDETSADPQTEKVYLDDDGYDNPFETGYNFEDAPAEPAPVYLEDDGYDNPLAAIQSGVAAELAAEDYADGADDDGAADGAWPPADAPVVDEPPAPEPVAMPEPVPVVEAPLPEPAAVQEQAVPVEVPEAEKPTEADTSAVQAIEEMKAEAPATDGVDAVLTKPAVVDDKTAQTQAATSTPVISAAAVTTATKPGADFKLLEQASGLESDMEYADAMIAKGGPDVADWQQVRDQLEVEMSDLLSKASHPQQLHSMATIIVSNLKKLRDTEKRLTSAPESAAALRERRAWVDSVRTWATRQQQLKAFLSKVERQTSLGKRGRSSTETLNLASSSKKQKT